MNLIDLGGGLKTLTHKTVVKRYAVAVDQDGECREFPALSYGQACQVATDLARQGLAVSVVVAFRMEQL